MSHSGRTCSQALTIVRYDFSVTSGALFALTERPSYEPEMDHVVMSTCAESSAEVADALMMYLFGPGTISNHELLSLMSDLFDKIVPHPSTSPRIRLIHPDTLQLNVDAIPDIVKLLLDNGADPNAQDICLLSPLMDSLSSELFPELIAGGDGHNIRRRTLGVLLEAGADALHRDSDGDSVSDYAWGYGHWDVWCEVLQEHGMDVMEVDRTKPQGRWWR